MNKEEFIGKLQMVYVGDRNAFNEIVEDNQKLKNEVVYSKVEIDRLNNIINEYMNHLIKKMNEFVIYDGDLSKIYEEEFDYLDKLKELKEVIKSE